MWHRYKMTPRSIKGHFKVSVNKLILILWLPRISIVTNLGKVMVKKKKKIDFFLFISNWVSAFKNDVQVWIIRVF